MGPSTAVSKPCWKNCPERLPIRGRWSGFSPFLRCGATATTNPEPVPEVLTRYVAWIKALPGRRASLFAASPLAFDGLWIDYYLRRFTRYGIAQGPSQETSYWTNPGLCMGSYAAAVTGQPVAEVSLLRRGSRNLAVA